MLKSYTNRLIQIVLGISLVSCHVLYVPNSFNSPLLRNKGDGQINFAASLSGFEAQTAYAFTDNFGVMVNGQLLNTT